MYQIKQNFGEKKVRKQIFSRIKSLGDMGKSVTDVDLQAIAEDALGVLPEKPVELQELTVVSGNKVTPTASVKINVDGIEKVEAGVGVGPVDAAIIAIKKSMKDVADIQLEEYHVDAITGGADALIDVVVKLKNGDNIVSARSTQPDIIMASVEAVLGGVNKIVSDKKINEANEKDKLSSDMN